VLELDLVTFDGRHGSAHSRVLVTVLNVPEGSEPEPTAPKQGCGSAPGLLVPAALLFWRRRQRTGS
jgi:hypothetical protein